MAGGEVLGKFPLRSDRPCALAECERPVGPKGGKGFCHMHYVRNKVHGDPRMRDYSANAARARSQRGSHHPRWAGDAVSYSMAHQRVYAARGPATAYLCAECRGTAQEWAYDGDDPRELVGMNGPYRCAYSVDPNHYDPLCKHCHALTDAARREVVRDGKR